MAEPPLRSRILNIREQWSSSEVAQMSTTKRGGVSTLTRVAVPALMFQAVAIGGAYATGREIIEFGGVFGALGWAAGAAMAAMGSFLAYLVYETARRHGLYDYRSMTRHLIGRFAWLFDAIYIPFALAILAVLSSATGNILRETLHLPYWLGVGIILAISAWVTFKGVETMERFNGIGTVLLMLGYALFSVLVITTRWDHLVGVFTRGDQSLTPGAGLGDALLMGAVYVGLGFVIYPSTLVTVRHLRTQREAAASALLTGGLFVVPWFLTYFALMAHYPAPEVFDSPVPWLTMLQQTDRWIIVLYGVLVGWTLVATAVGLIQSVLLRIDQNLVEATGHSLGSRPRTIITVGALVVGAMLSSIGIIDLIAVGYLYGAIALIVVFGLPLLVRGIPYLVSGDTGGQGTESDLSGGDPADQKAQRP